MTAEEKVENERLDPLEDEMNAEREILFLNTTNKLYRSMIT